ncbi:MAG: 4-alpha-glucanotransferase [bacterium]
MPLKERASGILLHPTSLPGKYGIGTLGQGAYKFIDFLVKAKQKYWQILPLGPTGYADSPYQCFSAHAGNPNLVDLDLLVKKHLLKAEDLQGIIIHDEGKVDFGTIQGIRTPLLEKAYNNFTDHADNTEKVRFRNFIKEQAHWLNDFALFMAIKEHFGLKPWYLWDEPVKRREPEVLKQLQTLLQEKIEFHKFLQFLFFIQWIDVKEYAHRKKVRIIGDIPLYIALDSADAWSNPELFEFDEKRNPIRVGGVPPDYFSETGQLWGNPLYLWDIHRETGYRWWIERIRTNLLLFDIIRIDHFRGFAAYWAVPYAEKTAINGIWTEGPGRGFFDALQGEFIDLQIIAEDLGVITPDVEELRDGLALPGMKILEFAFDSSEANDYLPHNFTKNCVVYTGTHDNDTVLGWFKDAKEEDQRYVLNYMDTKLDYINWSFIRLAWASVANTAIVPMQDLLGLGSEARMNLPGTTSGNWSWRSRSSDFSDEIADRLADLTLLYGRIKKPKKQTTP